MSNVDSVLLVVSRRQTALTLLNAAVKSCGNHLPAPWKAEGRNLKKRGERLLIRCSLPSCSHRPSHRMVWTRKGQKERKRMRERNERGSWLDKKLHGNGFWGVVCLQRYQVWECSPHCRNAGQIVWLWTFPFSSRGEIEVQNHEICYLN